MSENMQFQEVGEKFFFVEKLGFEGREGLSEAGRKPAA
jgi:hypothetical protein